MVSVGREGEGKQRPSFCLRMPEQTAVKSALGTPCHILEMVPSAAPPVASGRLVLGSPEVCESDKMWTSFKK
ncbi:hypothetical protein E2C01_037999 [Portunus trituberculatus]|uniref:Uncharacterized protein n=1 Tax=Portunus trituberculatus TaxID=210409 RepID=A0A5B7FG38_PORTR|nr:hypothetical protein [Portunus trituberculatus]